jgi:hypothetical protein
MKKLLLASLLALSFNAQACSYQDGWNCPSPPVYIPVPVAPPVYIPPVSSGQPPVMTPYNPGR